MPKSTILLFLFLSSFFIACDDDDPGFIRDKEIRLIFPSDYDTSNEPEYQIPAEYTHLLGFDINNYPEVDSLFFHCAIASSDLSDTVSVRLFNLTDSTAIEQSELTASTIPQGYEWLSSINLIDFLPAKKVDLAIQIKSQSSMGGYGSVWGAYLKLKRK